MRKSLLLSAMLLALAACTSDTAAPPEAATPAAQRDAAPAGQAPVTPLKDIIERNSEYLIGITFPVIANQHPKLATALHQYAEGARKDLLEAVESVKGSPNNLLPYDLSLNFTENIRQPGTILIAADGSLYTGGAHGMPLIARFTYLPQQDHLLKVDDLIEGEASWQAVSALARKQLNAQLKARLEEDSIPEDEQEKIITTASRMIEEGTEPEVDNFTQFEPLPTVGGKWAGLRFVFPPYQVGPYSDGTQSVDIPASQLLPHIRADYRNLFVGG